MNFRQQLDQDHSFSGMGQWRKGMKTHKPTGGPFSFHSPQQNPLRQSTESLQFRPYPPQIQHHQPRFKTESDFFRNKLGRQPINKPFPIQDPRESRIHAINKTISPNQSMNIHHPNHYHFYYHNAPMKTQVSSSQNSTLRIEQQNRSLQPLSIQKLQGVNNEQILNSFEGAKEDNRKIDELKARNRQNEETNQQLKSQLVLLEKKIREQEIVINKLEKQGQYGRGAQEELQKIHSEGGKTERKIHELTMKNQQLSQQYEQVIRKNAEAKVCILQLKNQNERITLQFTEKERIFKEKQKNIQMVDELNAQISGIEKEWLSKNNILESKIGELQRDNQENKKLYAALREERDSIFQQRSSMAERYRKDLLLLKQNQQEKDYFIKKLTSQLQSIREELNDPKVSKLQENQREVLIMQKEIQNLQAELANKTTTIQELMIMMSNNQKEVASKYRKELEGTIEKYENRIKQISTSSPTGIFSSEEKEQLVKTYTQELKAKEIEYQRNISLIKQEEGRKIKVLESKLKEEVEVLQKNILTITEESQNRVLEKNSLNVQYKQLSENFSEYKKKVQVIIPHLEEANSNLEREVINLRHKLEEVYINAEADQRKYSQIRERVEEEGNSEFFIKMIDEMGIQNENLRDRNSNLKELLAQKGVEVNEQTTIRPVSMKYIINKLQSQQANLEKLMHSEILRLNALLSFQQKKLCNASSEISSIKLKGKRMQSVE